MIDGYVLPDDPGVLLGTGAQAKVPLLIGYNAPPKVVDKVLTMYPAAEDLSAAEALLRMFSDVRFITPMVLTARAASKVTDVHVYRFSPVSLLNRSTFGDAGRTDIPYIFGHITAGDSQYEEVDRTVSRAMAGVWQ